MNKMRLEEWNDLQRPKQRPREDSGRYTSRERTRRRRKAQRIRILRRRILVSVFLIFLLLLTFVIRGIINHKQDKTEETAVVEEAPVEDVEIVENEETIKERVERVRKMATEGQYPEDVIELLSKNPETVKFVEEYETMKDQPVAQVVSEQLVKGEIPQLLQWDQRWGYASYGTGFVATCGCGPTCLSMVISGLTGDATITPAVVAHYSDENGYIDDDNNTYWELMTEAPRHWGLQAENVAISEETVKESLAKGNPIICSVGPGDFTKIGHFIVLVKYDKGNVTVYDPFNQKNSEKTWKYSKIKDQFKSMWVFSE